MKKEKFWKIICILAVIAYTVKSLFIGADMDEGYGIMAGYRLAMGDRLLLEMWEPHQTSAIFTAVFIKLFMMMTGGINYLNLYLRIVSLLIQGGVAVYLYKTLRKVWPGMEQGTVTLLAMLYYIVTPKCVYVPEYSNLHNWFFTLMILCMLRYFFGEKKISYLVWSGIFMTCDVLAYPSMVLVFIFCMGYLLLHKSDRKWKECAAYLLPCVISAGAMSAYLCSYMAPATMLQMVGEILNEGSHKMTLFEKIVSWSEGFAIVGALLILAAVAALAVKLLITKLLKKKLPEGLQVPGLFFLTAVLLIQVWFWLFGPSSAIYPQVPLVGILFAGLYIFLRKDRSQKTTAYIMGIACVSYFAALLLSNWGPDVLNTYLILGAVAGLLCIGTYWDKVEEKGRKVFRILCLCLVLGNAFGYCYLMIGASENHAPVFSNVRGINREGLRAGILTDYMSAFRYNNNMEIWNEAVPSGSTVLYVGASQFYCMLGEHTQASPDTICSMVYDERLLDYWKINPDRYPDVVVFESCYGDISAEGENSFIWDWLQNDFQPTDRVDYPYITVFMR